jgi:hypothetical protein
MKSSSLAVLVSCLGLPTLLLSGCGGDNPPPPPPSAFDVDYTMSENDQLSDALDATNVDWDTVTFYIDEAPDFGSVELNADTGDFIYTPDDNFVGSDGFTWDCTDRWGDSNVAEVDIDVESDTAQNVTVRSDGVLVCQR